MKNIPLFPPQKYLMCTLRKSSRRKALINLLLSLLLLILGITNCIELKKIRPLLNQMHHPIQRTILKELPHNY